MMKKMYWTKNVEAYYVKYDKIFAASEAVKNTFCKIYPQFKNKVDVFYNVIDIKEIRRKAEFNETVPYKADMFNILTCGRLV